MNGKDIRPGDILVIKTTEEMLDDGGRHDDVGGIELPDSYYFHKNMKHLCGESIVVEDVVDRGRYWKVIPERMEILFDGDHSYWVLTAEMLKPFTKEIEAFANNDLDSLLGF